MAGNPFDNPTMSIMYQDALHSLYNGSVMPWDREILAIAPLPADVVDPFASQDVDPIQIMGFAYNSLVTWIDEARKANYFSKRFTDLSKLVLKGVMTMGRGLITLHNRGEDLSRTSMQIGDLISVGSYHFRKSYLGVIQTAKSHPEISERLLVNQLSWTNMLLRLYKTKEKLAENKKSETSRNKKSEIRNKISASAEELPEGNSDNSTFLTLNSSLNKNDARAFSEVDALFEPAALSAPRALRSLEGNKKSETSENKKSELRNKRNEEVRRKNEETESGDRDQVSGVRDSGARIEEQRSRLNEEGRTSDNEDVRMKNEETESGDRDQVSGVRDSGTRIKEQGTSSNEEGRTSDNEEGRTSDNEEVRRKNEETESGDRDQVSGVRDSGARIEDQGSSDNEEVRMKNEESDTDGVETENPKPVSDIITNEKEKPREDELPNGNDDSSFLPLHSSLNDDSSFLPLHSSFEDDLPPYLQILRDAFGRSEPNEEGRLTFTFDEIRYLASDPDFARIYPDAAADMRKIQMQIDTG